MPSTTFRTKATSFLPAARWTWRTPCSAKCCGSAIPALAQQLLSRVSTRLGRRYAEQMNGIAVQERLHDLADWLRVHGIPSKVDEEADAFVFTEYGCPYYGLAREHREVCDMEIEALELGPGFAGDPVPVAARRAPRLPVSGEEAIGVKPQAPSAEEAEETELTLFREK